MPAVRDLKKKKAPVRKGDYIAGPVQKLAYKLGLVNNPDVNAVREEAYGAGTKKKLDSFNAKLDADMAKTRADADRIIARGSLGGNKGQPSSTQKEGRALQSRSVVKKPEPEKKPVSVDAATKKAASTAFNTAAPGPSVATKRDYPVPPAKKADPDKAAKDAAKTAFNTAMPAEGRGRGVSGKAVAPAAQPKPSDKKTMPPGPNRVVDPKSINRDGKGDLPVAVQTKPPKPKAKPTITAGALKKTKSFKEGFAEARAKGREVFEWEGKKYNTRVKGESKKTNLKTMKAKRAAERQKILGR